MNQKEPESPETSVTLRMSRRQLAVIDGTARDLGLSRSDVIRRLLDKALGGDARRPTAALQAALDKLKPLIDAARMIEAAYGQSLGTLGPRLIKLSRDLPRLDEYRPPDGAILVDKAAWDEQQQRLAQLVQLAKSREADR